MIVQKDVHLDESVHFLLAPFVPQSTATRSIEAQRLCGAFQYFRFSPLSFDLENDRAETPQRSKLPSSVTADTSIRRKSLSSSKTEQSTDSSLRRM